MCFLTRGCDENKNKSDENVFRFFFISKALKLNLPKYLYVYFYFIVEITYGIISELIIYLCKKL